MDLSLDAIEFDVWLSRDKIPCLMHDSKAFITANDPTALLKMLG